MGDEGEFKKGEKSGIHGGSAKEWEQEVLERLRRVEGQIRGLQRMISEGQSCRNVVTQISAVRSALDRAAFLYFAAHMKECLSASEGQGQGDMPTVDEMMEMFLQLS
jgi:DNA-binding FrmR family transcriptional regulator